MQILASEPLVRRLADQLSPEAARLAHQWGLDPDDSDAADPYQAAGTVLAVEPGVGLVVATGGCPLLVREARLEGKAAVAGTSLIQQWGGQLGDRFGDDQLPTPRPERP